MERDRRGHFLKLLGLALGVALIAWVFRDVELSAIANRLAAIGPLGGLLVLLPALGSGLLETVGWHGVFSLIGTRIGFPALFRVRTATEAAAQTLPAGVVVSESLKVALLSRGGMAVDAAVSGTLARKYLLMTSQSAYIVLAALFGYGALEALSHHLLGRGGFTPLLVLVGLGIGLGALGIRSLLSHGRLATRLRARLGRIPSRRLERAFANSESWSSSMDHRIERFFRVRSRDELAVTAWFLGGWLFESLETFLLLWLVGVPLDFGTAMAVEVVLSMLRMAVFIVPGGLGIQDAGYALFLHALGVPDATAAGAAFAVLKRSKELAYALLGYALLALELRPERDFRNGRKPLGQHFVRTAAESAESPFP
jgi:uncharacterized membrane protein YbhN (UPF0104 family)